MDPSQFRIKAERQDHGPSSLSNLPPPPTPKYKQKSKPKAPRLYPLLILLILVVLGLGGWVAKTHLHKAKLKSANAPTSTSQPATSSSGGSNATTSYSSPNFATSFNYPNGWTVADSGSSPLTLTSPALSLISVAGQSVNGQIVMTLNNQGTLPSGFGGQSVAVLDSVKVSYLSPTSSQAASTYVTFIQYPATTTHGGLDGIYVSGNLGYTKDQSIPSSDLNKVSPLVYFSFFTCSSSDCSSRTPLTIASSMWNNSSFSTPLVNIIKSFSFD